MKHTLMTENRQESLINILVLRITSINMTHLTNQYMFIHILNVLIIGELRSDPVYGLINTVTIEDDGAFSIENTSEDNIHEHDTHDRPIQLSFTGNKHFKNLSYISSNIFFFTLNWLHK